MGVTRENGKYRARYSLNGVRHNVGVFNSEHAARIAIGKHRKKQQELDEFFLPDEDIEGPFIPDPVPKKHVVNLPKPSIRSRVGKLFAKINEKVNNI